MLGGKSRKIDAQIISESIFKQEMDDNVKSIVGHEDTANVLGVPMNRENITLDDDDVLLVAQLNGGRLPEGATTLPDGFSFTYYIVRII